MLIRAAQKVHFSKKWKTLKLFINKYTAYCEVIRSTQWTNSPRQRNGFMATYRFCAANGGVETQYKIKTKTSLLVLIK